MISYTKQKEVELPWWVWKVRDLPGYNMFPLPCEPALLQVNTCGLFGTQFKNQQICLPRRSYRQYQWHQLSSFFFFIEK